MITLKRRRSGGRHRVGDQPAHQGWEGHYMHGLHTLGLLADRDLATTTPACGSTEDTVECPVDQCPWVATSATPDGRDTELLHHALNHTPGDWVTTTRRLRRAVQKLQDLT